MLNILIGLLSIAIGFIMGVYSIYEMRFKNKIILPSVLIVFIHFFMITGIFLITKNIGLGFIAMIFYNIVFVAEIISYILKNRDISNYIEELKSKADDEFKFWQTIFNENHRFIDDYECFEYMLRIDALVEKANELDLNYIVQPLLTYLQKNKSYFKDYDISRIAKEIGISKSKWWFYLNEQ